MKLLRRQANTRPGEGSQYWRVAVRGVIAAVFGGILVAGLSSCSPQRKHAILTFFFDGVPPLEKPVEQPVAEESEESESAAPLRDAIMARAREKTLEGSVHEPYRLAADGTKQCGQCHDSASMNVLQSVPQLCKQCHGSFISGRKFVHGPAAVFECRFCHYPHKSPNAHLLTRYDESLCYQCHDRSDVEAAPYHPKPATAQCWQCHDPHGAENRMFLLAGISTYGAAQVSGSGEN